MTADRPHADATRPDRETVSRTDVAARVRLDRGSGGVGARVRSALARARGLLRGVGSGGGSQTRTSPCSILATVPLIAVSLDRVGRVRSIDGLGARSLPSGWRSVVGRSIFAVCDLLPVDVRGVRRALTGNDAAATVEFGGLVFDVRYHPVRDAAGTVTGVTGVALDITARRREEASVRQSEERFRSLVQHASDIVMVVDASGLIRSQSASVERVLGYPQASGLGKIALDLIHTEDQAEMRRAFAAVAATERGSVTLEFRARHADGSLRHFEAVCTNRLHDPSVGGVVVTARDVTERKSFEADLAYQALHDPLTGLPNRALFMERLEHALADTARGEAPLAVLFLDLDRFKVINDSLGHAIGDELLTAAGQRFATRLNLVDTIARFGGDEYVILLESAADSEEAEQVARALLSELRRPFHIQEHDLVVSASVGIALGTAGVTHAGDLLRAADVAVVEAKSRGKSRYVVFDAEMNDRAVAKQELEAEFRRAIRHDELRVFYQPIVHLARTELFGVEALVRWQHPVRGLVPPTEFIPLAEETGLIVQVGRWVLTEACRQAQAWARDFPGPSPVVSVNLSMLEFRQPDLVRAVGSALRQSGLRPDCLALEVTESAMMERIEETVGVLRDLKALGVRLNIDDFGTGYSSLSYLKRLPVDGIKIDKSFIDEIETDVQDAAIIETMISLCRTLDLEVTAEGVETEAQLARLTALGCHFGQGYLLGRPEPAERITARLAAAPRLPGSTRRTA